MPNTYTQINIHAIFAVKGRGSFISGKFADELYKYVITGCYTKIFANCLILIVNHINAEK